MRLDSVRNLKNELPRRLETTFVHARRATSNMAVAMAASRRRTTPSYFLGVAPGHKSGSYVLAVRLQDRALETSALVDEITTRARGEVDVRYVGRVRARPAGRAALPWYQSRNRPLLIGSSVGFLLPDSVMAGTLGVFVRKRGRKDLFILSNNHVLADENRYGKGKPILQPGALDGGTAARSAVSRLSDFVALDPSKPNFTDCAIARLDRGIDADVATLKGIGTLSGMASGNLEVKDVVHKVGRTTGIRHGRVTAIELDGVVVEYDIGDVTFDNQVEIEGSGRRSFSDSGDSGSLIVDDDRRAAALLFAGSDHGGTNDKGLTYANPLDVVLSALKVELVF